MKQLVGFILLILLMPLSAAAETVQAFVDRARTPVDTPVTLSVSIPGREGGVDTTAIRDFHVNARGSSTRVEIINGRMRQEQVQEFLLTPKRPGNFTLPPLSVTADGKTYQTEPIAIEVISSNAEPTGGGREIEVSGEVSERSPYVGQQLIYTFRLRFGVQIANIQYNQPDFLGFTAKQIGEQQTRQRVVAGRRLQEIELSYLLIPIKSGELTIGSAELRCDAVSSNESRGAGRDRFLGDPFFSDRFWGGRQLSPRVLRTETLPLTIRPLPPESGPASFSGLVGQFTIDTSLEANEIKVGDSVTFSVSIQGTGNIMDADTPTVMVPDGFKQYADSPQSEIKLGPNGYEGKKVFRLALVAMTPGSYQVAPAPLTYFDPKDAVYRGLSVPAMPITVYPADKVADTPVVFSSPAGDEPLPEVRKKKVDFTGRDILPLKSGLDAMAPCDRFSTSLFLVALFIPVGLFLISQIILNLNKKNGNIGIVMAQKSLGAIKQASRVIGVGGDPFLSQLHRAMVYAVCARAKTSSEALTYEEARRMLDAAGVFPEHAERVTGLMSEIDSARYSGKVLDLPAREDLLAEIVRLLKEVQR